MLLKSMIVILSVIDIVVTYAYLNSLIENL